MIFECFVTDFKIKFEIHKVFDSLSKRFYVEKGFKKPFFFFVFFANMVIKPAFKPFLVDFQAYFNG